MKLLVTGGSGFIGSNFILYWMKHHPDDSVVNLDVLTYAGNQDNLAPVASKPNYRFICGDIRDEKTAARSMEGIDVVVHFAAESHVDRSIHDPSVFLTTNILGTYTVLEAALKAKVKRFHHISTDEVFGSLPLDDPKRFSETAAYDPSSPYAASKAGSDHIVRAYYTTYNLQVTITNCSNNFGPLQYPEKLIPLAITNMLTGKKAPVYGDGKNVRDWLYVEDHCRAIDIVLSRGVVGQTYCIGGMTEDISNLEVVKKIAGYLGKDESWLEFVPDRPGHDRRYALDWLKIKRELGWEPEHDFDTWLQKTVEWYKEHEIWWRKLL